MPWSSKKLLFSESKTEVGPEVEMRAPCRARPSVVESLKFKPEEKPQAQLALPALKATYTKKMTMFHNSQASKSSSTLTTEVGRKKQKSARPLATKKSAPIPQESQMGEEVQ
ncbi:hypothetical protein ACFX15_012577 [Malus domestica]